MTKRRGAFLSELMEAFAANSGVDDVSAFDPVENEIACPLPADYKGFLLRANGGETLPPLLRFRFYPVEELVVRRADGQPTDVLEFGTDDGDGFAFDLTRDRVTADYRVVKYPLGDTTREDIEEVAESFSSFARNLAATRV